MQFRGRILRAVAQARTRQTGLLLQAEWFRDLMSEGSLPKTVEIPAPAAINDSDRWGWLEHEKLAFPCYAHEITVLQLYDSAMLTLRVAIEAARHGWILKDASAWNVLFSVGRPVFVDILSFDAMDGTGTWIAYGQFVRHFLLPLLLYRKVGITPPEIFHLNRDGITPEYAFNLLRGIDRYSATAFEFVVLPRMLSPAGSRMVADKMHAKPKTFPPDMAQELVLNKLHRLQRKIQSLRPDWQSAQSTWKQYEEERLHYSDMDLASKKRFVREALTSCRTVLDLGCNAGEFSLLAAEAGCEVTSADFDHPALCRLYSRIRSGKLSISPLMLNIGRPTPAIGWANQEIGSFLDRSAAYFDCILMLGLIHHLLVSERATVEMLVELLDTMGAKSLILEWVDPADVRFRQLAGLHQQLYKYLTTELFEAAFSKKFRLVAKLPLPCATRVMYFWCR